MEEKLFVDNIPVQYEDDDDEVIREVDVYVTNNLDLFVTQFPLKPVYADPIEVKTAKFKPNHVKLELEVPYSNESLSNFENRKYVDMNQTFSSSTVALNANLGAAIIQINTMYINPITSVLQLKPSFKNLKSREIIEQMADDDFIDDNDEDKRDNVKIEAKNLQQVQMKRKESERAMSARLQSFAYLQQQEELEPWVSLQVYEIGIHDFVFSTSLRYYNI